MAKVNLTRRGIDAAQVSIDSLLDEESIRRIQDRFSSHFTLQAKLDCYDLAMSIAAGIVAGAVDILAVRIPINLKFNGSLQQGSYLTHLLRGIDIPGQTWLSQNCKVAFDHIKLPEAAEIISGFGGRTHRLLAIGHDPLLGLVFGTLDIMRGSLSAIGADGSLHYFSGLSPGLPDPLSALAIEIGHLFSDAFTKMGLPAPGWSMTQALQFGSFGNNQRTVADLARFMYLKGYDSRHFLTMTTSVAAAEVVLRAYMPMRQFIDSEYAAALSRESSHAGWDEIGQHPRYQAMATIAHLIACSCNVGKIAIYQGNPLALNYAQWLRFVRSAIEWQRSKMTQPAYLLQRQAEDQLDFLETRWEARAYSADDFPTLHTSVQL